MVRPMKKSIILGGLALLLATACHKADYDAFGGHSDDADNPVRAYMVALADDIVAASLEELEAALQLDLQDPITQVMYDAKGSLLTPGGTWKVRRESALKGLVLQCEQGIDGSSIWNISFDGDLELRGEIFPTQFSFYAHPEGSQSNAAHQDWNVTSFHGDRYEREGYNCSFDCFEGTLRFEALPENGYWNAYGTFSMNVFKGETLVDSAYLSLKGAPSAAIFVHGLEQ